MSKITSLIRRAPKRMSGIVAMVAAAIVVPTIAFAYGPDRATFTYEHPADHITFNSITDNPNVGDERNFVRIKEDGTSANYGKTVALTPGKTYDVEVYYHNNAASNLNLVAKDTTLRMEVPGVVNAGGTANINGFISASNATPGTVYDTATATNGTAGAIAIDYVDGSAKVTSNGAINGQTLPDTLFTSGAKLGYDGQDGNLPGCNQYAGYVTFKFTVNQPNFTVQKQVSVDSGKTWNSSATTTPGSTVQYRVIYTNTGTTQQDNVTLSDTLPKNVSYVTGSALVANAKTSGAYQATSDGITTTGLNIGSYGPTSNAYFKFSAKVADESSLACGANTLVNTARATTSGGYKESTATLTVNKTCTPGQITVCDLSTNKVVTIDESKFDSSKYSKDLTVCKTTTTTVVPPTLPHTGPTETFLGIVGLGAIVASLGYFISSRRALMKNL